jgi:predicted O-methyltransferase YrrM
MSTRYYEHVPGWFDFQGLYSEIVKSAKDGDKLVEVGSFLGKSACYMLEEIDKSKKNLPFFCVDVWDLTKDDQFAETAEMPWGEKYVDFTRKIGNTAFYDFFCHNIKFSPSAKFLTGKIQNYSWEAAKSFNDESCFFVFIDAGHSYESVKKDLVAWYPKVKKGGIFAGHDIIGEGVVKALKEFCNENKIAEFFQYGPCWVIYVK